MGVKLFKVQLRHLALHFFLLALTAASKGMFTYALCNAHKLQFWPGPGSNWGNRISSPASKDAKRAERNKYSNIFKYSNNSQRINSYSKIFGHKIYNKYIQIFIRWLWATPNIFEHSFGHTGSNWGNRISSPASKDAESRA